MSIEVVEERCSHPWAGTWTASFYCYSCQDIEAWKPVYCWTLWIADFLEKQGEMYMFFLVRDISICLTQNAEDTEG